MSDAIPMAFGRSSIIERHAVNKNGNTFLFYAARDIDAIPRAPMGLSSGNGADRQRRHFGCARPHMQGEAVSACIGTAAQLCPYSLTKAPMGVAGE
jgi:hypothetical protein